MISEFQVEANWTAAALLEHNYNDLAKLMLLSLCVVDSVFHFSGGQHNNNQIWQQIDMKTCLQIRVLSRYRPPTQLKSVSAGGCLDYISKRRRGPFSFHGHTLHYSDMNLISTLYKILISGHVKM